MTPLSTALGWNGHDLGLFPQLSVFGCAMVGLVVMDNPALYVQVDYIGNNTEEVFMAFLLAQWKALVILCSSHRSVHNTPWLSSSDTSYPKLPQIDIQVNSCSKPLSKARQQASINTRLPQLPVQTKVKLMY